MKNYNERTENKKVRTHYAITTFLFPLRSDVQNNEYGTKRSNTNPSIDLNVYSHPCERVYVRVHITTFP